MHPKFSLLELAYAQQTEALKKKFRDDQALAASEHLPPAALARVTKHRKAGGAQRASPYRVDKDALVLEFGPGKLDPFEPLPAGIETTPAAGRFAVVSGVLEHVPGPLVPEALKRIRVAAPHGVIRIKSKAWLAWVSTLAGPEFRPTHIEVWPTDAITEIQY